MKRVKGAERKLLVMSEAERQVCWYKGSKGVLLGAGGTAAAVAEGGKGAACRHTTNKSCCQGKGPSVRLLPRLGKRDRAFCMLYFLRSPAQDLGLRRHSELLFACLANI